MPTIGTTTKPNGGTTESYSSTYNASAETLTMPERGRLTRLGSWFAGVSGNARARLCVWDSTTLALLGQSAQFTAASRSWAAGNVDRYEADLETPVEIDEGVVFYVGFSRHPDDAHQFTGRTTGAHVDDKQLGTWPAALTGFDPGNHGFGTYSVGFYVANYEPIAGAWVRRSGAWVRAETVAVRRSGAWVDVDAVMVKRGAAWVDAD